MDPSSSLIPDWFLTHNRYSSTNNYLSHEVTNATKLKRRSCLETLRSTAARDHIGHADFLSFDADANALRRSMVRSQLRTERAYLAKSFAGPTCNTRECRDTMIPYADTILRQGMRELTRDSKEWDHGVYQRWFSYHDDPRYWEDHKRFMSAHGNSSSQLLSRCVSCVSVVHVLYRVDRRGDL